MRLETRVQSRRRRHADFSKLSITHAMSERSSISSIDWPASSCATVAVVVVADAGASTACRRRLPFKASLAAIISAVQRQPRDCHRKPQAQAKTRAQAEALVRTQQQPMLTDCNCCACQPALPPSLLAGTFLANKFKNFKRFRRFLAAAANCRGKFETRERFA